MNIEPCVRLGIRISPKISEKPADNRNNRPPNVTLLTVSSSQNVISAALATCHAPRKRNIQLSRRVQPLHRATLHPLRLLDHPLSRMMTAAAISTSPAADNPANRPGARGIPPPASPRTG